MKSEKGVQFCNEHGAQRNTHTQDKQGGSISSQIFQLTNYQYSSALWSSSENVVINQCFMSKFMVGTDSQLLLQFFAIHCQRMLRTALW